MHITMRILIRSWVNGMFRHISLKRKNPVLSLIAGVLVGFFLTLYFHNALLPEGRTYTCFIQKQGNVMVYKRAPPVDLTTLTEDKRLLFVGVMTAEKFLDSRAVAVYETWGKIIPGKIIFFSSSNSKASSQLPLVTLPGVDDSYPPQKKSFLMLKYMYDHFIDKFEWFMRADDDVYVRTDKLEKFLRSINSSKAQFIGQAGLGNKDEFGQLSLDDGENFCMGGPGMLMSRETLQLLAPHIRYCLKHLYSTHEDVELGRCIRRFVGIPCTWSYEMQNIFYQNFAGEETFMGRLKMKEVHRAITLHPIKQPPYLYRLHRYFLHLQSLELRYRTLLLHRDILNMNMLLEANDSLSLNDAEYRHNMQLGVKPALNRYHPKNREDVLVWDFFSKHMYSANNPNPKRRIEAYTQTAINDTVMEVMEIINKFSKQRGRVIEFQDILYGYQRVNPLYGVDYVLDLMMKYKKYRGRKMTVPVRRHAYLQQTFSQPEIREISSSYITDEMRNEDYTESGAKMLRKVTEINFILPLAGRTSTFHRFLSNFEEVCLQNKEGVTLAVVLFSMSDGDSVDAKTALQGLQMRYPKYSLRILESSGSFSRAMALEIGAKLFPSDALLFFIDVDMMFDRNVLKRVRLNTVQGKQVYFPIVFSQYSPQFVPKGSKPNFIHDETGYWRQFGYGIVSLYNSDLYAVGGLDTTIHGWGKEDVDLYTKVVHSNISVFRAADPGLIHIFHDIKCDSQLEVTQFQMCIGSKLSSLGSQESLAQKIFNNPEQFLD
ncbi:chondroitin sulfate synthase 1-like [Tachypleus tridentatus]|uniref:chondroitin sulfate synthase 1-like n=1 Tax=Tachypleus tridentatus TaxID=6853 RepID=UPI003FD2E00A